MADPNFKYQSRAYTGPAIPKSSQAPSGPPASQQAYSQAPTYPSSYNQSSAYQTDVPQPQAASYPPYPQSSGYQPTAAQFKYPSNPAYPEAAYQPSNQQYYPNSQWSAPAASQWQLPNANPQSQMGDYQWQSGGGSYPQSSGYNQFNPSQGPSVSGVGGPIPIVRTIQPIQPSQPSQPQVNPVPVGGPSPAAMSSKPRSDFSYKLPEAPAAPHKPVATLECNACKKSIPEFDFYERKCVDPNHSVCWDCVKAAYAAKDSPECPVCQQEYSEYELQSIHQILPFDAKYKDLAGLPAKKPGAGMMEMCTFGHQTHKANIVPNACESGHIVCVTHYRGATCSCGKVLGAHINGDLSQFEKDEQA